MWFSLSLIDSTGSTANTLNRSAAVIRTSCLHVINIDWLTDNHSNHIIIASYRITKFVFSDFGNLNRIILIANEGTVLTIIFPYYRSWGSETESLLTFYIKIRTFELREKYAKTLHNSNTTDKLFFSHPPSKVSIKTFHSHSHSKQISTSNSTESCSERKVHLKEEVWTALKSTECLHKGSFAGEESGKEVGGAWRTLRGVK